MELSDDVQCALPTVISIVKDMLVTANIG
jgi:hypothetical protein